jgi:hypothetical protein
MENEMSDIKINIQNPSLNITTDKVISTGISMSDNNEPIINSEFNSTSNFKTHDGSSFYLYKLDTKKSTKEDNENREKFYKKTPNTKIQILTQEIYLNRKNIIKNCEKNQFKINAKFMPVNTSFDSNISFPNVSNHIHTYPSFKNESFSSIEKLNNFHSCSKDNDDISISKCPSKKCKKEITSKNISESRRIEKHTIETEKTNDRVSPTESHVCEIENTSPDLTDSTDSLDSLSLNSTNKDVSGDIVKPHEYKDKFYKEHKRRHYRRFNKLRKKNINDTIENCINENEYTDDLSQSDCSPRIIDTSLWNDNVENYYIEFQKICVSESVKYKQLNYTHKLVSNLLKFILLISSCFTFTLSLSSPESIFFQVTTTITSILTTIITSIISFFTFEKRSEIEYYIYKGLDKINQTISIELIKPSQIRSDPYELILSLQNQRDELLKKLHKKI